MQQKERKYSVVVDSDEELTSFTSKLNELEIDHTNEDLELRLNSYRFKGQTVTIHVNDNNRIVKWQYNTSTE
jgi:hypothetical protein